MPEKGVIKKKGHSDEEEAPTKGRKRKKNEAESVIASVLPGLNIAHPSDVLDMPVDPNEPTYCLCHQVSYGEMIACDKPDVRNDFRCDYGRVFIDLFGVLSAVLTSVYEYG